jgi:hypothetical protein
LCHDDFFRHCHDLIWKTHGIEDIPSPRAAANRLFARAFRISRHFIGRRRRRREIRPLARLRLSTLEIFPQRQLQAILALAFGSLSRGPLACLPVIRHGRPACLRRHLTAIAVIEAGTKAHMRSNCGYFA